MELLLERKKIKDHELGMMVGFYLIVLGLGCIPLLNQPTAFILPMIMVAYCCGYKYVFMYYVALISSCFFVSSNEMIVVMAISLGIFFQIANVLKITNIFYMPVLIGGVTTFYLAVYQLDHRTIFITTILSLVHCYLYKELIPMIIHQTMDTYGKKKGLVVCIIALLFTTVFYEVNPIFMIILIRYLLLLSINYLSMAVAIPAVLYISMLLLLQDQIFIYDILATLLPCFVYFIYKPANKLQCASLYLISHIFLPFFIEYEYIYHGFIIITSCLLFMVTPKITVEKQQVIQQYIGTNRQKLQQKTDSFCELFQQLIGVFQETNSLVPVQQYVDYTIEDVCSNCVGKEYCFRSKHGTTRVVKLMLKGIKEGLDKEDEVYIEEYCLNADHYLNKVRQYYQSYYRAKLANKENQFLKEDLLEEFSVLSCVFENFHDNLEHDQVTEHHLFEHLKGYHFDIQHLKRQGIGRESFFLDIGIMNSSKEAIMQELVPIVESFYQQKFSIESLQASVPRYGYMSLRLKHDSEFIVEHGFQQMSFDRFVCGDNYTVFKKGNTHYFALSDGMGQGVAANKESKLTLDVLSKLVMNGISLFDTIDAVNALLRIKNRSDMYTTLDLCTIDTSSGKASFIKYGANTTYYVHKNIVTKLESNSLPVGVIKDVKMTTYDREVQEEDLIILTSDGVGERFEYLIESQLKFFKNKHAQTIASSLLQEVQKEQGKDDTSILVIKIMK